MRKITLGDKTLLKLKTLIYILLISFLAILIAYSIIQYENFKPENITFNTQSIKVFDKNENFLWEISKDNAVRNTPITFEDIPKSCINAIVSIEDKNFWTNNGVDLNGLIRFGISLLTYGSQGGGSTISQQLIKTSSQRIYNRNPIDKLNEMIAAIKLNRYYSKEQILTMYLNNIFFGQLDYGIESASQEYYGKSAKDLNLAECAYLMGIPQWPGVYNPYVSVERGKLRQKEVLDAMQKNNYISASEKSDALDYNLIFSPKQIDVKAPHFIQYLQDKYNILKSDNNENQYGISFQNASDINTTYDYELHKQVLQIAKNNVKKNINKKVNNAAVVILDKQANLLTMIGSIDFFNDSIDGKFNSSLGLRQPGSSINSIIYTVALAEGKNNENLLANLNFEAEITKDNTVETVPVLNASGNESKEINIYNSIQNNLTIPAVELVKEFGVTKITDDIKKFDINIPNDKWCNEIMSLEGCEINLLSLTQFYNILSSGNSDLAHEINQIKYKITNKSIAYTALSKLDIENNLSNAMTQVKEILENTNQDGWVIIGGDTRNFKDSFAFGYNNKYTVGVWSGNTKGEAMDGVTNSDVAVPIVNEIIKVLE